MRKPARLRHAVGRSTLAEGFAIPRSLENWVGAPARGQKHPVSLAFGGQRICATLRRLDNEHGHVQVKYDNRAGDAFRRWLASTFGASTEGPCGEFFELVKSGPDEFEVIAFPVASGSSQRLAVAEWLFHRGAQRFLEKDAALREIPAVVHSVELAQEKGQEHYNRALSASFQDWAWETECRIVPELGLKCDFAKAGVQVEVEFGNARTYYQDYVKFLLGRRQRVAKVGVLIVPTESFASHLCAIGRQRAREKGRERYSGMIHFEKVRRELAYLEFMLTMPIAIAGIGPG